MCICRWVSVGFYVVYSIMQQRKKLELFFPVLKVPFLEIKIFKRPPRNLYLFLKCSNMLYSSGLIALPPWLTEYNCDPHSFNITSQGCPAHLLMEGNNIYSIHCWYMQIFIFYFLLTILKPRVALSSTIESSPIHIKTLFENVMDIY